MKPTHNADSPWAILMVEQSRDGRDVTITSNVDARTCDQWIADFGPHIDGHFAIYIVEKPVIRPL